MASSKAYLECKKWKRKEANECKKSYTQKQTQTNRHSRNITRRSNIKFRTIENSQVKTTKQFSKKQNV